MTWTHAAWIVIACAAIGAVYCGVRATQYGRKLHGSPILGMLKHPPPLREIFYLAWIVWVVLFVAIMALGMINQAINGPAPLPHQRTMVCEDGTKIPPGFHRGNCELYGGFVRYE